MEDKGFRTRMYVREMKWDNFVILGSDQLSFERMLHTGKAEVGEFYFAVEGRLPAVVYMIAQLLANNDELRVKVLETLNHFFTQEAMKERAGGPSDAPKEEKPKGDTSGIIKLVEW